MAEFPRRGERGGLSGGDGGVQATALRASRGAGSPRDARADRYLLSERGRVLSAASRNAGHANELLGEHSGGGAVVPVASGSVHRAHLRDASAAEDHQPCAAPRGGFRGVGEGEGLVGRYAIAYGELFAEGSLFPQALTILGATAKVNSNNAMRGAVEVGGERKVRRRCTKR